MAHKYKVLHLVESLDIGGLEKLTAEIVGGLNKNEFEAEIWSIYRGGALVDDLRKRGIAVRVLGISSYYNPFNIFKLAKAFKEAKPDIIHSHVYFASTIGRLAGKIANVKVLINHVHSTYTHYNYRNLLIERVLSGITCKTICVSNSVKEFVLTKEKISPSKVDVIYNGISFKDQLTRQQARQKYNAADHELIITTVANLHINKGHKVLLDAFSNILKKSPQVKCWIIGKGPEEKELKEQVKELNIEANVIFWGGRSDVFDMLAASDIFVLASIEREGMALSVVEAMASNVPVVVTKVGGLPELIQDKKEGLVIPPNDSNKLTEALEELINDPHKRQIFAQEANKKFHAKFESQKMISRIEQLYRDCLK
jgi:glycosyltransferase involved in cell wall biosynthesis